MAIDWQEWMAKNHVKIRGHIPDDNGPDESKAGNAVSGTEVETEVSDDAGETGGSHIQKPE